MIAGSVRGLVLVALVLLAGCVAGPAGQSETTSAQSEMTGTNTSAATTDATPATAERSFPNRTLDWPSGPKPVPDRPDELRADTVREFVNETEYRYAYNSLYYSTYSDVQVGCSVTDATAAGNGYVVWVRCYGYSNTRGESGPNSTVTPTRLHADWGSREVAYYVDENSLLRSREGFGIDR